jgi:S1-C subfamily serine protease
MPGALRRGPALGLLVAAATPVLGACGGGGTVGAAPKATATAPAPAPDAPVPRAGGEGDGGVGGRGRAGAARASAPDAAGGALAPAARTRVEVVRGLHGFDPEAIYRQEAPGVVTVTSVFGTDGDGGVGSGFVLNGAGEIATNAHVVTTGRVPKLRQADEVYVEFADGNRVAATVRGYDPNADVALLRVRAPGLTLRPLPLGSARDVRVGMPVAAIGSPFGERQSLSVGVVSGLDRSISSLTAFRIPGAIQTDAAINPGNSGGPLVDGRGRVIGINQQISTDNGRGEGVGFAVPIGVVERSLAGLRADGEVAYSYVGIESVGVYPQLARRFGLPVEHGAWVQNVTDGGPAARAGLRGGGDRSAVFQARDYDEGGDVVTRIAGRAVADPDDLADAIAPLAPGTTVDVVAWRGGTRRTLRLELGTRPLSPPARTG